MPTNYTIRWFLTIFIGLVFVASGACKLLGDPVFEGWFREFEIPLAYMRALGLVEIVGALALAIPWLARPATLGLLGIAIFASGLHLVLGQPVHALLPTALASAAAFVVWGPPGQLVTGAEPKVLAEGETRERSPSFGSVWASV